MMSPDPLETSLVNVPIPAIDEAASSWLTRFALSQGTDLKTAAQFIGVPHEGDVDLVMVGPILQSVIRKCGLPSQALALHERIMLNLIELEYFGSLLLTTSAKKPLVRFCKHCLHEMRDPYFPVHWRFAPWQWCPIHDCLMEEACQICYSRPASLVDVFETSAGKKGYVKFNRCLRCGAKLNLPVSPLTRSQRFDNLVQERQRQVSNGRALLAALYHGHFHIVDKKIMRPVAALGKVMSRDDFIFSMSPNQPRTKKRFAPKWVPPQITWDSCLRVVKHLPGQKVKQ